MKKEIFICDICKEEGAKGEQLQTIFTTEQTEGRSVEPYLTTSRMDLCDSCKKRVLAGEAIWAHGAQGHNTYYFKEKEK